MTTLRNKAILPRKAPDGIVNEIVPIVLGGTSANNIQQDILNLNLIPTELIDQEGGIVKLENNNLIPERLFDLSLLNKVSLEGQLLIGTNEQVQFTINDFSSFINYTISASLGTITRNEEVVTYIAPNVPATDVMTLNNRNKTVSIFQSNIRTPTITSPVNNLIDVGPTITLVSNAFKANGQADTHERSHWQVATDIDFTTIVSNINNITNLTSVFINNLLANTTYYIRVQHKGLNIGWSEWSSIISFTTKVVFLPINETAKLIPNDAFDIVYSYSEHAVSLSLSQDKSTLVVGSEGAYNYYNNLNSKYNNRVHVYNNNNGVFTQIDTLYPSRVEGDNLVNQGASFSLQVDVSGDGNIIVIGNSAFSYLGQQFIGHLHIFTKSGNTWVETNVFSASFSYLGDLFGMSVKINDIGNRIVVGMGDEFFNDLDTIGSQKVAAYIYDKDINGVWSLSDIIRPTMIGLGEWNQPEEYCSVDLSETNNRLVLSYRQNNTGYVFGKVEVYNLINSVWTLEQTFIGNDSNKYSYGCNNKLNNDGTKLFIPYTDFTTGVIGVDIYFRNNNVWTLEDTVTSGTLNSPITNVEATGRIKDFISINSDGSILVVGNPGDIVNTKTRGSFSIFNKTNLGWVKETTITSQSVIQQDNVIYFAFGQSIELSQDGSLCLVGNPIDVENYSTNRIFGAVFVYSS
jgi:hypothetical protein